MANLVNKTLRYFDLQSGARSSDARAFSGTGGENLGVAAQYAALVLGILVQPYLTAFQTTGDWKVTFDAFMDWGLFALIVGLLIFPAVYRNAFDPGQPRFVQFCVIFAAGVGWKALLAVAMKAVPTGG